MNRLRSLDIKYLKGIGPARADILNKQIGIRSYYDLIYYFPTHYIDRSSIYKINSLQGDMPSIQIRGHFIAFSVQGHGAKTRLVGLFTDGTGTLEVVWFQRIKSLKDAYHIGNEYILFGKPTEFNNHWSMVHPEVDIPSSIGALQGLRGIYPLTETLRNKGISSRTIFNWIQIALNSIQHITETLSTPIITKLNLIPIKEALVTIHNPKDNESLQKAKFRLKFEELFYLQLNILQYSHRRLAELNGFRFSHIGHFFNAFYNQCLPFELTNAQKRVIKEIRADIRTGHQMNRLLQGDVGSGKTLVALMCMLIAIDNGTQACLMAPTEILAMQHYETIYKLITPIGINVKLLTRSTHKKKRDLIHAQLQDGSLHILIGTHAVIEEDVQFSNLGFVVIDEQHRFGVAQRAKLWNKNITPPHVLVMTATPIPRTLAMTIYGDLDISVIDELPPGRKPIQTLLRYENHRLQVYQALTKQLQLGRQAYIVYPLIQESEKFDLLCLEEGYKMIKESFPMFKIAYVHGKMKPLEKKHQMNLFVTHQADILVATTVIEVGVDVPNATTMIIENAERFGLSQLHQLRGRVGRGEGQSYCILMTKNKIAKETRQRMEIMTATTDGFEIAEADLKMRGPGDLEGTMQSGIAFNLRIANIATDGQIIQLARDTAEEILDSDPSLSHPSNTMLRLQLSALYDKKMDWSRIS